MGNFTNFLDAANKLVQSFTDDKKPPLHVGEVMSVWMYLAFVEEIIVYEEVGLNTTEDEEVKRMIEDAKEVATAHKKQLKEFMKQEGIPFPLEPQYKPVSQPNAIPPGAKFSDSDIMNALSINFATVIVMCAQSASQSIRNDVGFMFLKFQMEKMALGTRIKVLLTKKGWLKTPPPYYAPGVPKLDR